MAEGWEEKEFHQFDWWRAKFCPLCLHTGGHCPKENASKMPTWQSFLRVLVPRVSPLDQEFGQDKNGNPNNGWKEELWHQEFLLSAKNIGSLGDGLLLGWPSCDATLKEWTLLHRIGINLSSLVIVTVIYSVAKRPPQHYF
jgi:hypothetical protein